MYLIWKKIIHICILAVSLLMLLMASVSAADADPGVFRAEGGGFKVSLPKDAHEIFRTPSSIRLIKGDQLIYIDSYILPNFLAVSMKNYSEQQIADFERLIVKIQDYPDFVLQNSVLKKKEAREVLQKKRSLLQEKQKHSERKELQIVASLKKTPTVITSDIKLPLDDDNAYSFILKHSANNAVPRNYIIGKAFQNKRDRLVVVSVSAPEVSKNAAAASLQEYLKDFDLTKAEYPDENTIIVKDLNFRIDLPTDWHAQTLRAPNIIFARSLSTVHHEECMIRGFKTKDFTSFARANAQQLPAEEKAFVEKITKYTPNVTVIKHQAVTINGINSSIMESTDSVDLKKVFVVNAYLLDRNGMAYQIRFNTDDTINYDLKINAFVNAIKSFKHNKE